MPGPTHDRRPSPETIQVKPMTLTEAKAAALPLDNMTRMLDSIENMMIRKATEGDLDLAQLPGAMASVIEATGFIVNQRRIIHSLTHGLIDTPGR